MAIIIKLVLVSLGAVLFQVGLDSVTFLLKMICHPLELHQVAGMAAVNAKDVFPKIKLGFVLQIQILNNTPSCVGVERSMCKYQVGFLSAGGHYPRGVGEAMVTRLQI